MDPSTSLLRSYEEQAACALSVVALAKSEGMTQVRLSYSTKFGSHGLGYMAYDVCYKFKYDSLLTMVAIPFSSIVMTG
jgi:hypothetical protein